MSERYNLIEENWIPSVSRNFVSLKDIFNCDIPINIGGNAIEKISILKFLLAIVQVAVKPKNRADILNLQNEEMCKQVLNYLENNYNLFYLYGKKPIFQIPNVYAAKVKTFSEVSLEIASGNTSVLYSSQRERDFTESDKVLLLLTMMGFAAGGKKVDNSLVLTPGYKLKSNEKGNPCSSKYGPSLGFKGYLHTFLVRENIIDTLRLNLFPEDYIDNLSLFPAGIGNPPWECPPKGEACDFALNISRSYLGSLIPYSRFMLLCEDGIHFTEGIRYDSNHNERHDLSMSVMLNTKKPRVLWVEPERSVASELKYFLNQDQDSKNYFYCHQIQNALLNLTEEEKNIRSSTSELKIWSGGLKLSSKAGEQYCSGNDDYHFEELEIDSRLHKQEFQELFFKYVEIIKNYESLLYYSVRFYNEELNLDYAKYIADASNYFWHILREEITYLFDLIEYDDEKVLKNFVFKKTCQIYNEICPATSAIRIMAHAKHSPGLNKGA